MRVAATHRQLPQGGSWDEARNWACKFGNSVARAADSLGAASGRIELTGLGVTAGGFVTAQPELIAAGLALAATGGTGGVLSGGMQFGAGILQGLGGGGYSNSAYAAASLASGWVLARGIIGPAHSGYRTASQRANDAFLDGTATVVGGVNGTFVSFVEAAAPRQVNCPGGN